jgi:hypothetical protein
MEKYLWITGVANSFRDSFSTNCCHPHSCHAVSVCPSGWGGGLKIHCKQLRVGSNPTADICSQRACVSVSWWNDEFYWMTVTPCSLCFILHFSFHGICQVHVALVVRVALSLLPSSAVSFFQPSGQLPLLFSRYAWSRLRSLVMTIWR